MDNRKEHKDVSATKCQGDTEDGDNVFLENRFAHQSDEASLNSTKNESSSIPTSYSRFLFDPRDIRYHSGSGHRRNPSYDSRESTKSVSDCSYVSGSPCESPGLHEMSLQSLSSSSSTPFSSTCAMSVHHNVASDSNPFCSEKDFVDYLLTLPPSSSKPEQCSSHTAAPPSLPPPLPIIKPAPPTQTRQSPPQIGLDHLENLCKLMEQLGELREHNSKLQKRVQYLEEMRNLNEMRQNLKEVLEDAIATSPTIVTGGSSGNIFAFEDNNQGQTLAQSAAPTNNKRSVTNQVKLRQMSSKRRSKQNKGRSQSMGDDDIAYGHQMLRQTFQNATGNKAKVSKWAKVKEALKWERVQVDPKGSGSNATLSADNSDGGHQGQTLVSKASVTLKPVSTANKGDFATRSDYEDLTKHKPVQSAAVKYLQKTDTMREIIVPGQLTENLDASDPFCPTICPSSSKEFCYESESSSDEDLINLTDPRNKRRSLGNNVSVVDAGQDEPIRSPSRKTKSKETIPADDDQLKMRKGRSLERNVDGGKVTLRSSQSEKENNKKLSKGAWGKVKTILQTRKDSLKRKHRKSACLDAAGDADKCVSVEGDIYGSDDVWLANNEETHATTPTRTGSDVETQQTKSKHSSSSSNYGFDDAGEPISTDKAKSGAKAPKPPHLTIAIPPEEPKSKVAAADNAESSPTYLQSQTSKWTKVKKAFHNNAREDECLSANQRPQSVPASPSNLNTFRYDDLDFLEEYFRETKELGECSSQNEGEDNSGLSELQRNRNRMSMVEREPGFPVNMSSELRRHLEDMQRNVTEDFTKKMQEWEKLKSSYSGSKHPNAVGGHGYGQQPSSPRLDRKYSSFSGQKCKKGGKSEKWEQQGKTNKDKHPVEREQQKGEKQREKELLWLEKQLQKIEREKQRLAKERQKYLEREARLEKMRETMMKPAATSEKKEILVKTSAGEFRFQGISENFTRKLHEWETMRGIGPEVSTLTLLGNQNSPSSIVTSNSDSNMNFSAASKSQKQNDYDYNSLAPPPNGFGGHYGRMTERNRSHSESSLANMTNVQTSTTSLVTRPDDLLNIDYINDHEMYVDTDSSSVNALSYSRANSEPEIALSSMLHDGGPCAMEVEQMHFEESIPCLEIPEFPVEKPVYSYAPVEVTQLIDSGSSSDAEKEVQIVEREKPKQDQPALAKDQNETETNTRPMLRQNAIDKDSSNFDGQLKPTPTKVKLTTVGPINVEIPEPENVFFRDMWERQDTAVERKKTDDEHSYPSPKVDHSSKKNGVKKVKEISAELIQQAKTLEQTLLEKNVTIRQLQWELLQREMSNKRFQSELEKVTGQAGLLSESPVSTPASKSKTSHQRSWSAVEATQAKRMEEMEHKRANANQSPLELIKINEKTELVSSPIGLAQKVDELKLELKNLWGSQESNTNSICSESTGDKDSWTKKQKESISEKTSLAEEQIKLYELWNVSGTAADDKIKMNTSNVAPASESKPNLEMVAIRRVSDTVIPPYIQSQSNSRISKLPMSPQMNRSKSLSQNSTPNTSRKIAKPVSQMSPEVTVRSLSQSRIPAKKTSVTSPCLQRQTCVEESNATTSASPSVKLTRQRKLASIKDANHHILRRQNAEDYASSSDTDSESSTGVTFTINVASRLMVNKSHFTDSPTQQRSVTSNVVESPSLSRAYYSMKPPATSTVNAPWRKSSKDEEIVDLSCNDGAHSEEKLSAPSTPIVRSRSTRKLKPPTANKSEAMPTSLVTQTSISPMTTRRETCKENTAPNVRLMIEKFNKKVDDINNPLQSSPNMSTNRSCFERYGATVFGVKKSTSFNDSANYEDENVVSTTGIPRSSNSSCVVKSASASVIEKSTSHKQYCSKPPLSPEISHKKIANASQQPVGIASRIPRCLTAICEQESSDNKGELMVDIYKESSIPQSPQSQQKFMCKDREKLQQNESGSPKIGIRALEIKRAKENFFTKNPAPATIKSQPQVPIVSGWRSFYQRSTSASSSTTEPAESAEFPIQKSPSNVSTEAAAYPSPTKPKSILKHNNRPDAMVTDQTSIQPLHTEMATNNNRWPDENPAVADFGSKHDVDNDDDSEEIVGGRIIKCASAGAVDFATNYGFQSRDEPRMSTQSSTDSSDKHHKSTCGLFSFKFRRPKLSKHKKSSNTAVESLPAVKALCRQSLLVDFDQSAHDGILPSGSRMTSTSQQQQTATKTIPTASSISCPSSPESRPKQSLSKTSTTGTWQTKPKTFFKSK